MQKFPKVFTIMSAILALAFGLASCKSNADDDPTMYTVTVSSSIEHGTVTADKTSAEAGATIKLTATADSGYELDSYSVKDASENELTVTDGTFTMPESNVTVSATFKATTTGSGTTGSGTTSGGTEKQAGSISYDTASVSKTTDDAAFTNALTKTGDGTVTYASSKETVATVNATTGEVTIKGVGETTITATVADSDTYTYATKTATYTITVTQATTPTTYIGTKAPSEAKAVGDIVFNDGSATPYSEDLTLTDDEKNAAIAVIFYAGSASDTLGAKTLGIGLAQKRGGLAWCLDSANAYNVNITTIQESDKDGSDNLSQIGEFLDNNDDTDTADKYPAFYFAKNYASQTGSNVSGTDYADGWYLPSIAELQKIYDILSTVNNALPACGGTTFDTDGVYWSSSQCASDDSEAYRFYDGEWQTGSKSMTNRLVCAVRAFN